MFEYTDDYKLGISTIDEEHEKLVAMLNDAMEKIQNPELDLPAFATQLKANLQEYANTHFAHEESYMQSIQDPELPKQKKEHAAFMKKVNDFSVDETVSVQSLEEMMQYWVRWLFHHILHSDMMIGKMEAGETDVFAFSDKYRTGITLIDEEHQMLFDIIRQANDLIQTKVLHDKYDKIIEILTELREYTEKHFSDEEEYMEKIGYPKLPQQKAAHSAFVDELVNIDLGELDYIDDNQQEYLEDLITYLLDWLTNHILMSDKLIGEWEREH